MKRAVLPIFIAVAVIATVMLVYAVTQGALASRGRAAAAARGVGPAASPVASAASTPVGGPSSPAAVPADPAAAFTAEELHAVGLSQVKPGTRILDFELEDLSGAKVKLSGLGGNVVLLNFWATWCPPCRAEMPSMERLHARLGSKGLIVLGVDLQESLSDVQGFVSEYKLSFPVVIDKAGSTASSYGVRSIPTTYVVGRDGTILAGRIGGQEWDEPAVVALFEKMLAR